MKTLNRRQFFGGAAASMTALGALSTLPSTANAQLVYTTKDWRVEEFHSLAKHPARVKQVYDISPIGNGKFLNNIKNSLNGLQFGFGVPAEQIKIVAALHGPANFLNFDDFIWNKYRIGEFFKVDDAGTGKPALKNPYYLSKAGAESEHASKDPDNPKSIYQDTSIQALQHRDVAFLSCHTASEEQARLLIKHNNLSVQPEEIVKEMLAHTLPGVLVVASMVAAIALLQTDGGYSYITVG